MYIEVNKQINEIIVRKPDHQLIPHSVHICSSKNIEGLKKGKLRTKKKSISQSNQVLCKMEKRNTEQSKHF